MFVQNIVYIYTSPDVMYIYIYMIPNVIQTVFFLIYGVKLVNLKIGWEKIGWRYVKPLMLYSLGIKSPFSPAKLFIINQFLMIKITYYLTCKIRYIF